MDRETTIALLVVSLLLVVAGLAGDVARRRAPLAWHALMPWNAGIFIGLTMVVLLSAHLLSLRSG
ncbi:hypothetical protein [Polymorphobacter sp.]|uniref:hypothetical protein n=1 Tax=Polymorphobacter sp. TaxID=1909290 RepID=UPI003F7255EB